MYYTSYLIAVILLLSVILVTMFMVIDVSIIMIVMVVDVSIIMIVTTVVLSMVVGLRSINLIEGLTNLFLKGHGILFLFLALFIYQLRNLLVVLIVEAMQIHELVLKVFLCLSQSYKAKVVILFIDLRNNLNMTILSWRPQFICLLFVSIL